MRVAVGRGVTARVIVAVGVAVSVAGAWVSVAGTAVAVAGTDVVVGMGRVAVALARTGVDVGRGAAVAASRTAAVALGRGFGVGVGRAGGAVAGAAGRGVSVAVDAGEIFSSYRTPGVRSECDAEGAVTTGIEVRVGGGTPADLVGTGVGVGVASRATTTRVVLQLETAKSTITAASALFMMSRAQHIPDAGEGLGEWGTGRLGDWGLVRSPRHPVSRSPSHSLTDNRRLHVESAAHPGNSRSQDLGIRENPPDLVREAARRRPDGRALRDRRPALLAHAQSPALDVLRRPLHRGRRRRGARRAEGFAEGWRPGRHRVQGHAGGVRQARRSRCPLLLRSEPGDPGPDRKS